MPKGQVPFLPEAILNYGVAREYKFLERTCMKMPDLSKLPRMEFFYTNWHREEGEKKLEYDLYMGFSKTLPLWDKRKKRENQQYIPDVHERIFEQERDKPVPAMVSLDYGRPCRPFYDEQSKYKRISYISDFMRKKGVMKVIEKEPT